MLSEWEAYTHLKALRVDIPAPDPSADPMVTDIQHWLRDDGCGGRLRVSRALAKLEPEEMVRLFALWSPRHARALARTWYFAALTLPSHHLAPFHRTGTYEPSRVGYRVIGAMRAVCSYDQDLLWAAEWSGHLTREWGHEPWPLFAAEVSSGNTELRDVLVEIVAGRGEVSPPYRQAFSALLAATDPVGWEAVVEALTGAGLQEGARQEVLRAVPHARPGALQAVLDAVVERGLTRRTSVITHASKLLGEEFSVRQDARLLAALKRIRGFLAEPVGAEDLMALDSADDLYLGLWSRAVRDLLSARDTALEVLARDEALSDLRLAAARFLSFIDNDADRLLARWVNDPDPRVAAVAVHSYRLAKEGYIEGSWRTLDDAQIDALNAALERFGKSETYDAGVLVPLELELGRGVVADRLVAFGKDPDDPRLATAMRRSTVLGRGIVLNRDLRDPVARRTRLFRHLGDPSRKIRSRAYEVLRENVAEITSEEATYLESLLTRKATDIRVMVLGLLTRQPEAAMRATLTRFAAGTEELRAIGRELASVTGLAQAERDPIGASAAEDDPGRGILDIDHTRRTPAERPVPRPVPEGQVERCRLLVSSLGAWLSEHRDVEVELSYGTYLLQDVPQWGDRRPGRSGLFLAEVFDPWWESIAPSLTDGGVEIALVSMLAPLVQAWQAPPKNLPAGARIQPFPAWAGQAAARVIGDDVSLLRDWKLTRHLLSDLAERERRPNWLARELDAMGTVLAAMPGAPFQPEEVRRELTAFRERFGSPPQLEYDPRNQVLQLLWAVPHKLLPSVSNEDLRSMWLLSRFCDEPAGRHVPGTDPMWPSGERARRLGVRLDDPAALVPLRAPRRLPKVELAVLAYERGIATDEDLLDALTASREAADYSREHSPLGILTARNPKPWVLESPRSTALARRFAEAALRAEAGRGQFETEYSRVVDRIHRIEGVETLVRFLVALGKDKLVRGLTWDGSRESSFSRVIRRVTPAEDDTLEGFAEAVGQAGIPERRLVELGVYAPQWAGHVEHALGWPGLEDAVWWLHAHTKGEDWSVDREIRNEWAVEVSQRTPLGSADLVRGSVDVAWFARAREGLGDERFDQLLAAAKFASTAAGHTRATLFADALRGRVREGDLMTRIGSKRHQDSVRALGLLPLPAKGAKDEVLHRYVLMRDFVGSDRTSGSARRASERTAVEVGLENLARTAGYRDPQRLVWAIEAHAIQDLTAGPVTARDGDLEVTLSILADGSPELEVRRGNRRLAAVPKASGKVPEIAALRDRMKDLGAQVKRMRQSLEHACVTGDRMQIDEVAEMLRHPVLRPMLRDLVLVADDGTMGFTSERPDRLVDEHGRELQVEGALRIAHPVDLLASARWHDFQRVVFEQERRQPFRQLFRELYTPTESERAARSTSQRYAGHQVEPRKAGALFAARGWVADFEVGFTKTFHAERIVVWCDLPWVAGTAAKGVEPMVGGVSFHPPNPWLAFTLADVPPRIFSEVMRDLDLVVSVASSSGVDPEVSESTVEMRARVVEETATLLGLDNVERVGQHVVIRGSRGRYSIHLGSGVVHQQPGGSVWILPVPDEHRGRVFLPFMDDDPRTAEIVSKTLLLARDDTINDPAILAQLGV
jgi:hypothetical protein